MGEVRQAGAVIIRRDEHGRSVLLVRAKKNPSEWVFPKGHLESGETLRAAALRETREETGIRGLLLGKIGAPLKFKSGKEFVCVQYFLTFMMSEGSAAEQREKRWCSFSEALTLLSHESAKALLASVEAEINWWTREHERHSGDKAFADLMLAEFAQLGDAMIHNEESGEKRATFFLTFAGAIGAAVGFLSGKDGWLTNESRIVLAVTLGVLLLLGYATFVRVVVRNAESDLYKLRFARVRQYFLQGVEDPRRQFLPFDPFESKERRLGIWGGLGVGGWQETMAMVEALLAGALGMLAAAWLGNRYEGLQHINVQLGAGLVVTALTWLWLSERAKVLHRRRMTR
jgi:ADP-ribose pyrophosphatase YjhB (NUDIX family)